MSDPARAEALIVGAGVVSGAGRGLESFAHALEEAEPGQRSASLGDPALEPSYVKIPRHGCTKDTELASLFLKLACKDALFEAAPVLGPHPRLAFFVGTSLGGMNVIERAERLAFDPRGLRGAGLPCPPLPRARGLYHGPTAAVAQDLGLLAATITIDTACSSAAHALGLARRWLSHDRIDAALVAGFDVISPFVYAGFDALGVIDREPCAPFAARRSGLNLGEAAVAMVLVNAPASPPHRAICLTGFGASSDAYHPTRPDPTGAGLARAITKALADTNPREIALICAHGTGTRANDAMEDAAFTRVFDTHRPLVFCTKPVTGHTLGASGAMSALAAMLMLRRGSTFASCIRGEPDTALSFQPCREPRALPPAAKVLCTASGFGGNNAALILEARP